MRLESLSLICLNFLIKHVSSQSHTVVTQITTISGGQGEVATQTNIYSIDFGGPTQTIHGEQIQQVGTISVSAIVASNTLIVEESMTNNGTTENLDLDCNVHDGNQGDCSEVIEIFNSAATMATSVTFTRTLPSDGFFGSLPTGGGSRSSSQNTPAPSSPSSSPTSSNSPAPNPTSPAPSTSPTPSSVSSPPPTNPAAPTDTPNPASPTTSNPTPTTPSPNSPSPTMNSTDTPLPVDNSGAPLGSSPFLPVVILITTCALFVVGA